MSPARPMRPPVDPDPNEQHHPSYATIAVHRISGGRRLFGSEAPPQVDGKSQKFKEDLAETLAEYENRVKNVRALVDRMLTGAPIRKTDLKEVQDQLRILQGRFTTNATFVADQFTENVENTLLDARQEIEAYFLNRAIATGLDSGTPPPLTLDAGPATVDDHTDFDFDAFIQEEGPHDAR